MTLVFAVIAIVLFVGNSANTPENADTTSHDYQDVTLDELYETYKANKLRAEELYKDKYVRVSGIISVIGGIDGSDMFRVSEGSTWDNFTGEIILCRIANDDVRNAVISKNEGTR